MNIPTVDELPFEIMTPIENFVAKLAARRVLVVQELNALPKTGGALEQKRARKRLKAELKAIDDATFKAKRRGVTEAT